METNLRKRHLHLIAIFFFFISLIFSSGSIEIIKEKLISHKYQQHLEIIPNLISTMDGKMYVILTESLRSNLQNLDFNTAKANLMPLGINLESQEGRDLMYLAHTDRNRIIYSLLNIITGILFQNFSFLIINFIFYYLLIYISILYINPRRINGLFILGLLTFTGIPVYVLSYMPEIFLYFLLTVYFIKLKLLLNKVREERGKFGEPKEWLTRYTTWQLILIPIIAGLTKPVFIIILPLSIYMIFVLRRITPYPIIVNLISQLLFLYSWIITKNNNLDPLQLGKDKNPLKNLIKFSFPDLNLTNIKTDLSINKFNMIQFNQTLISEINAQISKNLNITIFLIITILAIFLIYKDTESYIFISFILFGCICTQLVSGGLGTNFRFLNYGLIISTLFAARLWEDSSP